MTESWYVLGAGSIGCLWAGYLGLAGVKATLLLKDEHTLRQYRQRGSGVVLLHNGSEASVPLSAERIDLPGRAIRNLLVTVKAHQTVNALRALRHRTDASTRIVLLQNGMGIVEQISQEFGPLKLLVGSSTEGAWQRERFTVVHAGRGQTWLGEFDSHLGSDSIETLLRSLSASGLGISWENDIGGRLWEKLVVNCAINAPSALLDCRNGALLSHAPGRRMIERICAEAETVLAAEKRQTSRPVLDTVEAVIRATADNYSSMNQDLRRGASTEIDFINGYLVRRARAHGLSTPGNALLVDMVHMKEALCSAATQ